MQSFIFFPLYILDGVHACLFFIYLSCSVNMTLYKNQPQQLFIFTILTTTNTTPPPYTSKRMFFTHTTLRMCLLTVVFYYFSFASSQVACVSKKKKKIQFLSFSSTLFLYILEFYAFFQISFSFLYLLKKYRKKETRVLFI